MEVKNDFLKISFPKPDTLKQKGIEEFDIFHVDRDKDVYFQVYFEIQIHGVKNNLEIYPWVKMNMKKLRKILIAMKNQDRSIEIPVNVCNAIPLTKLQKRLNLPLISTLMVKANFQD